MLCWATPPAWMKDWKTQCWMKNGRLHPRQPAEPTEQRETALPTQFAIHDSEYVGIAWNSRATTTQTKKKTCLSRMQYLIHASYISQKSGLPTSLAKLGTREISRIILHLLEAFITINALGQREVTKLAHFPWQACCTGPGRCGGLLGRLNSFDSIAAGAAGLQNMPWHHKSCCL